jgi:hypothetical protein
MYVTTRTTALVHSIISLSLSHLSVKERALESVSFLFRFVVSVRTKVVGSDLDYTLPQSPKLEQRSRSDRVSSDLYANLVHKSHYGTCLTISILCLRVAISLEQPT